MEILLQSCHFQMIHHPRSWMLLSKLNVIFIQVKSELLFSMFMVLVQFQLQLVAFQCKQDREL